MFYFITLIKFCMKILKNHDKNLKKIAKIKL